jgi:hypothetical protein
MAGAAPPPEYVVAEAAPTKARREAPAMTEVRMFLIFMSLFSLD